MPNCAVFELQSGRGMSTIRGLFTEENQRYA